MRYSLRLPAKSLPPYVDDVDLVGFLREQTIVTGEEDERKRARGTGMRELICHVTPSNVSKNRYNITQPLPVKMGENPLAEFVPSLGGAWIAPTQTKTVIADDSQPQDEKDIA
jgi:hypothetical protein